MVEGLFDRIDRMAIAEDAESKGLQKGLQKGEDIGLKKGEDIGLKKGENIGLKKGKEAGVKESLLKFVSNYMQSTHESLEKAFEVLKVSPQDQEYVRSSLSQTQP
ncbi:MAG: hypothetical protein SPL30_02535 [Succinivibrio sp.]|nr:hypothetical protein [Succinivibrio sp.]